MNDPILDLGLTAAEAQKRLAQYGRNELAGAGKQSFLKKTLKMIAEPMFLLLLAAAVIYFVLGEPRDGAIMLVFVAAIISIDVAQEWKTDRTLAALRQLSAPQVTVLRDGRETSIPSAELVPGDVMLLCEGVKIPADGEILKASDLCVDESSLTGESEGVWKLPVSSAPASEGYWRRDLCYAGTLVTQGSAAVRVTSTGSATEYGKIGLHVSQAEKTDTPLQKQTGKLVKTCAFIAAALFVFVGLVTYLNISDHTPGERVIESVLAGITLAMAMIPEEFPVILTVFLSMGAWRLAKKRSLVRKLPSVETLGAVSVLCVDKTGTITKNQMEVRELWSAGPQAELIETMGLGCEEETYDPMEKAMLRYCEEAGFPRSHLFGGRLITEYAFTNELKMMGHVWRHDGELLVCCKGSPERLLTICELTEDTRATAEAEALRMSQTGLRVIAVGVQRPETEDEVPDRIGACRLRLLGLVGLADPPRETVAADIARCVRAGVRIVMITGDNGVTAAAIARQIGIPHAEQIITGDELAAMDDDALCARVRDVSIFSRVIPADKMRIVKAFQRNGEIVAMTGDGVNDAPALKHADIGIAMGKRGSEVSREAADLILMDDNFSTIVDTIRDGRRIYDNIRKAVGYVFTIHIPIAASSLLAPILGVSPDALFLLPLHVVLLELVIDPTCSIVLERQPAETNVMERKPRSPEEKLLTAGGLCRSIAQGLMIFAASFGAYYGMLQSGFPAESARAMGLAVIMLANLFLVQMVSSDYDSACRSVLRLARDPVMWGVDLATLAMLALILYTPLAGFLKLAPLTLPQLLTAVGLAAASVVWYEGVKWIKRARAKRLG